MGGPGTGDGEASGEQRIVYASVWGNQTDVSIFRPHPLAYFVLTVDLSVG